MPMKRTWLRTGIAAVGVLVLASAGAFASHLFSDVPTSPASTHDSVSWMFTRAITTGCAPGLYCPTAAVDRAQMAIFMNRLGKALSPVHLFVEGSTGAFDLDAPSLRVCSTGDFTPTFPMRAVFIGGVSLVASGPFGALLDSVFSTDGGTTWGFLTGIFMRTGASAAGEWAHGTRQGILNLNAGTPYRFAIELLRESGTADPTASRCELLVQLTNRNPDGIVPDAVPASVAPRVREPGR